MQTPYDYLAKGLVEATLDGVCAVHLQHEVLAEVQAIDAFVVPDPGSVRERRARGLLGRMTDAPCAIEPFHDTPGVDRVDDCVLKVGALHAKQRRETPAGQPPPPRPALWIVSSGRPEGAMRCWAIRRMKGWPTGCYASAAPHGPRLVVVDELPRTRDTLLMRLMGAGDSLHDALDELVTLPADAWERAVAMPVLIALRHDLPRVQWVMKVQEEQPMRSYAEMKELWAQEQERQRQEVERAIVEGRQRGLREGREEGREEGRVLTLKELIERRLRRVLTPDETVVLRSRLATLGASRLDEVVLDFAPEAIVAWLADPGAR